MKINYDESGKVSEIKFEEGEDQKSFYENFDKITQNLSSKNDTDLFQRFPFPKELGKGMNQQLQHMNQQQLEFMQAQQQALYDMYSRAFNGDKNNPLNINNNDPFVKNGMFGVVNPVPGFMLSGGFGMGGINRMFEPSLASLNRKVSIFELMYKIYPEVKDIMKVPLDTIELSQHEGGITDDSITAAIESLLNDDSKMLTVDETKASIEFKKHVSKAFVYIIKAIDTALKYNDNPALSSLSYYSLFCKALGEEKVNVIINSKDE